MEQNENERIKTSLSSFQLLEENAMKTELYLLLRIPQQQQLIGSTNTKSAGLCLKN